MVFGIGEGKIIITLPKTIYAPGETIRGKAVLALNAPKNARALRLDLYRLVRSTSRVMTATGSRPTSSNQKIIEFTAQLAGEKAYANGEEYDFELVAPAGTSSLQLPPSPISGVISTLVSMALPVPRWFVSVTLDLPISVDISGSMQIQIQAPQQPAQNAPVQ